MVKIIKKKVIVFLMVLFTLVNLSVSFEKLHNNISLKFGSEVQAATNPVLRTPFIVDQRQKAFLSYSNNTWNTVYTNALLSNASSLNISYDGSKCYFIHCDTNTWTYTLYYYDFNLNTIIKCTGTEGVQCIVAAIDGNLYWSKDFDYEPNNMYRYSKVYAYNPKTDTNTYILQTSVHRFENVAGNFMSAIINSLAMSLDLKLFYTFDHNNVNLGNGDGAGCYDVKNNVSLGYTSGGDYKSHFIILSDNTVFMLDDEHTFRTHVSNIQKQQNGGIHFGWVSISNFYVEEYISAANQTIIGKTSSRGSWEKYDFQYGQLDEFSIQYIKDYDNSYTVMSNGEVFTKPLYSYSTQQIAPRYPIKEPQLPSLSINTPTINEKISEQTNCTPSITVSDADGDTLTCKYYIDSVLKETRTISNTATDKTVSFNSLNIDGLLEGRHELKFEVSDGIAQPVIKTISIIVDKCPKINNVTWTPQDTSISISVNASDTITPANNLQYQYTVGTMVSGWKSSNTHTITPLSPDNNYTVKVEVKDESGNITTSEQQVRTKLQVPQVTTSNIAVDSMDINISDSNPTTTQYQVMVGSNYVTSSGTLSSSPQWITLSNKKVTVTGLIPNTSYEIKAKAKNSQILNSDSAFSQQVAVTTLAQPPTNITLERSINSLKLSWNAVDNSLGYIVEFDGNTSSLVTVTENTYTHNNLDADSTHQYRIRIVNAGGAGPWSGYISGTTFPNPPETAPVLSITGKTQSSITIAWDAVASADGYEIETDEGVDSTEDLNLIYTTANSYTFENLEPDSLHKYHIRAKNEGGHSEWSTTIEESTLPNPPAIPQNVNGTSSRYGINLSWDETEGADGYHISIIGNNISYTQTTTSTFITIDGLTANSTYSYEISAYNEGGSSGWSAKQTIKTWPEIPKAPTNIMATAEMDSIALNWYNSAFAESYEIEIDGDIVVNNINETSYTSTGLTPNSSHNYRIRTRNISGVSGWSNPIEISTLPQETLEVNEDPSMANIVAVVTNKSVTLSWQAVKANAQYEVEVDGEVVDNGKNTVFNQTGLEPSTFHSYRVRTKDANGYGQWCAAIALSTLPNPPNAPQDVIACATNTQIILSWTKEDGVEYDVEIDGVIEEVGEVSSYPHNNLTPGTTHTYRVRAKNITGASWSNPITVTTTGLSYQIECISGTEFNFALLASNIQSFGNVKFVITYNPEELEVVDLCEYTQEHNIASGKIAGTNITVQYSAGRIEFVVNESIAPGTNWSGEITTIIYNPKINGMADININIE